MGEDDYLLQRHEIVGKIGLQRRLQNSVVCRAFHQYVRSVRPVREIVETFVAEYRAAAGQPAPADKKEMVP